MKHLARLAALTVAQSSARRAVADAIEPAHRLRHHQFTSRREQSDMMKDLNAPLKKLDAETKALP